MGDMIAAVRTSHVGGRDPSKGELGLDCTRPRREPGLDLLLLELLLLMVRWSGCWTRPGAAVSRTGRKEAVAMAAIAAGLLPHSCCCCIGCCCCCSGCLAASCCVAWLQGLRREGGGRAALDLSADQRERSAALLRPLELLRLPEMCKKEGNSGLVAVGRS